MRISELIANLQRAQQLHGDLEIVQWSDYNQLFYPTDSAMVRDIILNWNTWDDEESDKTKSVFAFDFRS